MNDKDQAAIDHVASVSKNPHAALIVKQLITGWDVEFEYAIGEWKISDYPSWAHDLKYRLIEPKPAKPAYRVYRYKPLNTTCTIDRDINGELKEELPPNSEWISEWIEYDPPKKWPTPLVERIAAINIKAAEWIVDHWDDLLDYRYTLNINTRYSNELESMFDWHESRCGYTYWKSISKQLGE